MDLPGCLAQLMDAVTTRVTIEGSKPSLFKADRTLFELTIPFARGSLFQISFTTTRGSRWLERRHLVNELGFRQLIIEAHRLDAATLCIAKHRRAKWGEMRVAHASNFTSTGV
jgi:hypothetical protein